MIALRWLAYVAAASLACSANSATPFVDWEFGRYAIGRSFQQPPPNIRERRDCLVKSNPFSCELLLGDGIWYRFENRRVVAKAIYLPSQVLPSWVVPTDDPKICKARLERITGLKFRIWTDDYGLTTVETVNLISARNGAWYGIYLSFRNGRMLDVYQTPLPHADD